MKSLVNHGWTRMNTDFRQWILAPFDYEDDDEEDLVAASPRCVHPWLKTLAQVVSVAVFFCLAISVHAAAPSNRWLLIVETSRATQPRMEGVAQTAGNLILSGMNGQVRPGDTLGVWTFDSELHAGEFPLQTLSPQNSKTVAERVALFLAMQKFEKRAGLENILPEMGELITNSQFITVILISSGEERIRGTPFDSEINAQYRALQSQQAAARMPLVTVLRAQRGRITDFVVSAPPAFLEMPALPPELRIVETPTPVEKPAEPKRIETPPPTPKAPPLIVRGKKPDLEPEPLTPLPPVAVLPTNQAVVSEIQTTPPPAPPVVVNRPSATITNVAATNVVTGPQTNQPPLAAGEIHSHRKPLWFAAGIVVIAAGAALSLAFLRRSRAASHASLITRSLERDKK